MKANNDLGWPLRGWLIFMILANGWSLFRTYEIISDLVRHADPRWDDRLWWALPVLTAVGCVSILALAAIWLRWKAGAYALALVSVTAVAIDIYIGVPATPILVSLAGLAVLAVLLQSRWWLFR